MKIFLAATMGNKNARNSKYILETFYTLKDKSLPQYLRDIPKENFLLDSGAFTFMNKAKEIDFDTYLDKYIDFINENDIKNFFELDIDVIVGYKKVLEMRKKLEQRTEKNVFQYGIDKEG